MLSPVLTNHLVLGLATASSNCSSHILDGPACEKELWDVHVWTIGQLLDEDESAASDYVNNLSDGAFQDDLSGIGCPKIALQLLQDAMRRRGFPQPTPMTFSRLSQT